MQRGSTQRGSVLLMVIGLLTVIAMLGSMLLLVSRLDRQTSQAIADIAPEYTVAEGVLDHLLADRQADLYIDGNGVLYGALRNADPNAAERGMIDYPADDPSSDQALACIEATGGTAWRHVSHLPGTVLLRDPSSPNDPSAAKDVPTNDPNLVDTDGDGLRDALLFATGVMDRDGGTFFAAVRMIDASGLLNVNVAEPNTPPADPYGVMEPNGVALSPLLPSSAGAVVTDRGNGPYDMSDMLAAVWKGTLGQDPSTMTGRLVGAVAAMGGTSEFLTARGSLTTLSATRGSLSPLWTCLNSGASTAKVNPNDPGLAPSVRYEAFLALLNSNDPNTDLSVNRLMAAQLYVNLLDYLDTDDIPTRIDAKGDLDSNFDPNTYVYGVERHPFVSKVFLKKVADPNDPNAPPTSISALELINPYRNPIELDKYFLKVGPATIDLGDKAIAANGRFVIRSDVAVQIDPSAFDPDNPSDPNHLDSNALDTAQVISVMWKSTDSPSWEICIDVAPPVDCSAPNAADPSYWNAKFRDDRLEFARYTLVGPTDTLADPSGQKDPNADYTRTDSNGPRMGLPNPYVPSDNDDRAPIYVRNGPLVSLGDMMRLLTVGPTDTVAVTEKLGALPSETGRRLVPHAVAMPQLPAIARPAIPAGCALSEFFELVPSNSSDNIVGRVNVNTAPAGVLECLPGLASLTQKRAVADEIIAYRDGGEISGRDYAHRDIVTDIERLRSQRGFAASGEVAIPLRRAYIALGLSIGFGDAPPMNFNIAPPQPSDDGLSIDPGMRVEDDLVKKHVLYTWLANQVTVRSNTFIAYIWVQRGQAPTAAPRRYVAVIDRSRCRTAVDRPQVLLFTELR